VAENHRVGKPERAGAGNGVGVTETGAADLDEYLVVSWWFEVDFFDAVVPCGLAGDSSCDPDARNLSVMKFSVPGGRVCRP
jgi:hypothetical protein